MPEALGDKRWEAIRAICEGAMPTNERMAAAAGIHVKSISKRAAAEGWSKLDWRRPCVRTAQLKMIEIAARAASGEEMDPVDAEAEQEASGFGAAEPAAALEPWPDEPPAARIARIGAVLTKHTETILRRAEAGQPLESRQITALASLVALSERIAALAREEVRRKEEESDETLRETLRIINLKIIYLAQCEAREIATQVFGIPRAEVDAKLPEPVDRALDPGRKQRRAKKAKG